jgi:hypothetical protein
MMLVLLKVVLSAAPTKGTIEVAIEVVAGPDDNEL